VTRVLIRFRLQKPLAESQLARLAVLRGVYGILNFEFDPDSPGLAVEYDATRLRPAEVGSLLRRNGIAVIAA
jgi:hypothetical protein